MNEKLKNIRKGLCPVCMREYALLKDGRITRHGSGRRNVWPPEICQGFGEQALTEDLS